MIGHASSIQYIVSIEVLKSGRITYVSQDGNQEFISLLTCIYVNKSILLSALIYSEKLKILQDIWILD